MVNHTQILNALIEKYNLKSYLEIGVQKKENNFHKIDLPWRHKFCVDPDLNAKADFVGTSDEYFIELDDRGKWDLIFIDGMHECQQVRRDFENSLKNLSDNGFICIHDVLPEKEETTHVPRNTLVWHGDVYKFAMNIGQYAGIGYKTFNIDHGCMLVWKENKEKEFEQPFPTDWQTYIAIRKQAMNIVDKVEI